MIPPVISAAVSVVEVVLEAAAPWRTENLVRWRMYPAPFAEKMTDTSVSPPVAEREGAFPVAALVRVTSFTAEAVTPNFKSSLLLVSLIDSPLDITSCTEAGMVALPLESTEAMMSPVSDWMLPPFAMKRIEP